MRTIVIGRRLEESFIEHEPTVNCELFLILIDDKGMSFIIASEQR